MTFRTRSKVQVEPQQLTIDYEMFRQNEASSTREHAQKDVGLDFYVIPYIGPQTVAFTQPGLITPASALSNEQATELRSFANVFNRNIFLGFDTIYENGFEVGLLGGEEVKLKRKYMDPNVIVHAIAHEIIHYIGIPYHLYEINGQFKKIWGNLSVNLDEPWPLLNMGRDEVNAHTGDTRVIGTSLTDRKNSFISLIKSTLSLTDQQVDTKFPCIPPETSFSTSNEVRQLMGFALGRCDWLTIEANGNVVPKSPDPGSPDAGAGPFWGELAVMNIDQFVRRDIISAKFRWAKILKGLGFIPFQVNGVNTPVPGTGYSKG